MPASFLLASGLLMALMTVDDLYQVHEDLAPRYLRLPEGEVMVAFYALLGLGWLVTFRRAIARTDYLRLVIATGCSAVSVTVDALTDAVHNIRYLVEDGFKLLGIVGWLGYLGRVCFRELTDP